MVTLFLECLFNVYLSWLGEQHHGNLRIFSTEELKNATHNFSSHNKIGEGAFGTVYKVIACIFLLKKDCSFLWFVVLKECAFW